jgi:nicotinamidase-related amidase
MNRADEELRSDTALLLVDVIHPFDFPGAEALLANAREVTPAICRLADRAREAEVPVIYVNDNFGRWRSSFEETVDTCLDGPGGALVERVQPTKRDYFVLKPHRSGFYGTPLELLLRALGVRSVVLCGFTTDMCILATANDARMRELKVCVVDDGTASLDGQRHREALDLMRTALDAEVVGADEVPLPMGG